MQKKQPGAHRSTSRRTRSRTRTRSCRRRARTSPTIAQPALDPARRRASRRSSYGKKTAKRILSVAKVIETVFLSRCSCCSRVDDADREHDPALDLLAAPGDRGDEARRRDELVRPRAVHARGAALRARRVGRRGACCSLLGKRARAAGDPRAHRRELATCSALAFGLTALILSRPGCSSGALGSGLTLRRFLQV